MSIRVTTGNQLDVVYDYENGKQRLLGLKRWGTEEIIPLPSPLGLVQVLENIVRECAMEKVPK
jgi:hypothetical protein